MKDRKTNKPAGTKLGDKSERSTDLLSVSLSGKDASKWYRFSSILYTRIRNLCDAVTSLDTFRRRSVGKELNKMLDAAIESAHAILDMAAAKNAKLRAETEAALAKAELDRARALAERSSTVAEELEEKRARQSAANRKIERMIARGELTFHEDERKVIIVYSPKTAEEETSEADQE